MDALKKSNCPNTLQLYESHEDKYNYYTVTKYMKAGSLDKYHALSRSESNIKKIIR